MHTLFLDLRYALRQLVKSPGFTLTSILSLALGIGATTAVFSVIYAALLNPFPYRAAGRIVRLSVQNQSGPGMYMISLNGQQVHQLQQLPTVETVLAMDFHFLTLTGRDVPQNVVSVDLIATGFRDLGMGVILGRGLGPADAPAGQDPQPVVVLSYKFWQRQFLASPSAIGQTLQLDRVNYTIVGVAGPRFTWYMADVYRPLKLLQGPDTAYVIDLRLKPGITLSAANSAVEPFLRQVAHDFPRRFPERFKVQLEGLNAWVVRSIGNTLYLLLAAVALLLAIGCGNVSILLLARGASRRHELALRMAIGAHRRRIVRQLLTESLLLAALGVLSGVALSYAILAVIRALLPQFAFAPEAVVRINAPVLLFSAAVALATGVLFGLWPALHLSRTDLGRVMQSGVRRVAGSVHGRRTHNALIAAQLALTLLLLAAAGSAMQAFSQLLHTPLGYDPHNVLSLLIPLHENSYTTWAARAAYLDQLRRKVAETPGVTIAAVSANATPPRNGSWMRFEILGAVSQREQSASLNLIGPGYFAALRIPLLAGRIWTDAENQNGAHLAVVNRTLAYRYFPKGDAVGRFLRLPALDNRPPRVLSAPKASEAWLTIAGIVEDARNDGLENPVTPAIFVPYPLSMGMFSQILVRATVPPLRLLHGLRAQLAAVNPEQQTMTTVEDLDQWIADQPQWQQERLVAWICGFFAALALTLALNTILGQWIKGNSHDPRILLAGALLLSLAAALACIFPAWRASAANPIAALRCE
jgi:predicted permease